MISESDESAIFNFLQRFHVFLETEQVFHRETSGRRAAGSLDTTLHMFSDCFSDRTFKRDVVFKHHQSTEEVFFVLMCFKTQSFSNIRGESRLKTTKRLSSQSEDQHRNCTLTSIVSSLLKFSFWMSSSKTSEDHPVVQTRHASLDGG